MVARPDPYGIGLALALTAEASHRLHIDGVEAGECVLDALLHRLVLGPPRHFMIARLFLDLGLAGCPARILIVTCQPSSADCISSP